MKKLRFVVLGDTHFCTREIRGEQGEHGLLSELPDHVRYVEMVDEILSPVFDRIRQLKPDFLISTGDFVEGCMPDDRGKTFREMTQGWEFMKKSGCPCLIAKGTHEGSGEKDAGAEAYREIVLPGMSAQTGMSVSREYFRYDKEDCVFLQLDYLAYDIGGEQDIWLEEQLKDATAQQKRIFIAAHPPLYNWGRHFFNEPEFIKRLTALCHAYPVDAYFCGHTHNQALSFHECGGGTGFLQVMGSTVGCPGLGLYALSEFHALAEFTPGDHYLWGIHEDCVPGFYLIEIDDDGMRVEWNSFKGDVASAYIKGRRTQPVEVKVPEYAALQHCLEASDLKQVKSALIYVYGLYHDVENTRVYFNGVDLGALPSNTAYAARRYVPLNNEALKTLTKDNEIRIQLPGQDVFVIGSISLEVVLLDNRFVRSQVSPELFVCGDCWKEFPAPREVVETRCGDVVNLNVSFD